MKLDIGGGNEAREGYINVDAYADEADVRAPMDCLPFANLSVDEVYSSHALEHVGKYQVAPTIREWYRVLRYGGLLVIEVPDFEWVCRNWLQKRNAGWDLDAVFGDQSSPGQYHKTGFTREIMYQRLLEAGFDGCEVKSTVRFSHNQSCLVFEVEK
jgi:predicted SAM-dependent methyltransferase